MQDPHWPQNNVIDNDLATNLQINDNSNNNNNNNNNTSNCNNNISARKNNSNNENDSSRYDGNYSEKGPTNDFHQRRISAPAIQDTSKPYTR